MEKLGMRQFSDIYCGKRVLVTGHSGFKGSWLSLWLSELGAELVGVSLDNSSQPNHWDSLKLRSNIKNNCIDIRNYNELIRVFQDTQPEIVFHLAAQPLVRRAYRDPLETWSTNVMGTANVLEACRKTSSVRAVLVVTTDKCYENQEWTWGYREIDKLGGNDPYSASKAGAELVTASYRNSYSQVEGSPLLATARAGNVIGGGDWSEDRLIPDLVRAVSTYQSLEIRSPNATRPWQHVLESLSGYLLLTKKLIEGDRRYEGAWNFGPDRSGTRTVAEVLHKLQALWPEMKWHQTHEQHPHEANLLCLDSAKAQSQLGWLPVWSLDETLKKTSDWYRTYLESYDTLSSQQLDDYVFTAFKSKLDWVSL
jgi:CDP-glucose 4,6-dehydratase